ncbi:MAG: alpha/beta hydrolase [Chthoniobacterales bacterium]
MKRSFAFFFLMAATCFAQQATPGLKASPESKATPDAAAPTPSPALVYKPLPEVSPTPKIEGMESENVVIGKGGNRDLHAELDWPTKPPKTPMPAIIIIHGGGWLSGEYRPNSARIFVNHGYFTMACEYRPDTEAVWPAQIEDCKLAVRWLRANAAKYNVDPNRIGIWGGSAGGHLAALLGSTENHPEFEGTGGYPGVSSKVQAVIDSFGPTDLRTGNVTEGSPTSKAANIDDMAGVVEALIGKKVADAPELYAQASPILYVHKDMAPFLIIHGTHDPTVSFQQSKTFVEAMQKVGANVQFIPVQNGGHGLVAEPGLAPATPDWNYIFPQMVAFFEKHLKN